MYIYRLILSGYTIPKREIKIKAEHISLFQMIIIQIIPQLLFPSLVVRIPSPSNIFTVSVTPVSDQADALSEYPSHNRPTFRLAVRTYVKYLAHVPPLLSPTLFIQTQ